MLDDIFGVVDLTWESSSSHVCVLLFRSIQLYGFGLFRFRFVIKQQFPEEGLPFHLCVSI